MFENISLSRLFGSERGGKERVEKLDNRKLHNLCFS